MKKKVLKKRTKITSMRFWHWPISKKLHVGYCEACTNRGPKMIAFTRQSIQDDFNEELMKEVLIKKVRKACGYYAKGKLVRKKVGLTGMVPKRSVEMERRKKV